MDPTAFEAVLFVIALAAGLCGGVLGMAGGIFVVPALTLFLGVGIHHAIGASIVSVIACSTGSAASFLESRLTNVRLALLLEVGTTAGALTGVFLSGLFPTALLYLLFAAILLVSAQQMFRQRSTPAGGAEAGIPDDRWATALRLNSTYSDPITREETPYRVARVWLALLLMYAAGAVSALLGIGSGVLKVPAMDAALRLPIKVSSATSNFMIAVTAAASAGIYYVKGDVVPRLAVPVALGSICGAYLGANILMRVSNQRIRALFIGVLIALAVQMLLAAFGIRMPMGHS